MYRIIIWNIIIYRARHIVRDRCTASHRNGSVQVRSSARRSYRPGYHIPALQIILYAYIHHTAQASLLFAWYNNLRPVLKACQVRGTAREINHWCSARDTIRSDREWHTKYPLEGWPEGSTTATTTATDVWCVTRDGLPLDVFSRP